MNLLYVNFNEDGEPYDYHHDFQPACDVLAEFPNDSIVVVVANGAAARTFKGDVDRLRRHDATLRTTLSSPTIDIRRAPGTELTLRCPECGMERIMPVNWQEIMRADAEPDWDGNLRCLNGHEPAVMTQVPLTGPHPHGMVQEEWRDDGKCIIKSCHVWKGQ